MWLEHPLEIKAFPDRHFWHEGYDKAFMHDILKQAFQNDHGA
jgi:hypothetical protein